MSQPSGPYTATRMAMAARLHSSGSRCLNTTLPCSHQADAKASRQRPTMPATIQKPALCLR